MLCKCCTHYQTTSNNALTCNKYELVLDECSTRCKAKQPYARMQIANANDCAQQQACGPSSWTARLFFQTTYFLLHLWNTRCIASQMRKTSTPKALLLQMHPCHRMQPSTTIAFNNLQCLPLQRSKIKACSNSSTHQNLFKHRLLANTTNTGFSLVDRNATCKGNALFTRLPSFILNTLFPKQLLSLLQAYFLRLLLARQIMPAPSLPNLGHCH